jgi:hypothetical protein
VRQLSFYTIQAPTNRSQTASATLRITLILAPLLPPAAGALGKNQGLRIGVEEGLEVGVIP